MGGGWPKRIEKEWALQELGSQYTMLGDGVVPLLEHWEERRQQDLAVLLRIMGIHVFFFIPNSCACRIQSRGVNMPHEYGMTRILVTPHREMPVTSASESGPWTPNQRPCARKEKGQGPLERLTVPFLG